VGSGQAGNPGLRERKKLELRRALSRAALRLAMELGPENVRIEDITGAVGVSYRTFANYFGSREEAIVAVAVDRVARTVELFRARPLGEPLAEALAIAFTRPHPDPARAAGTGTGTDTDARDGAPEQAETWLPRLRELLVAPMLSGAYLAGRSSTERSLAEAIAERTNTDVARDLYPRALAAAVLGAEHAAVEFSLDTGATASGPDLVRQAIEQVVNRVPLGEANATAEKPAATDTGDATGAIEKLPS
jgi:AcrR family transcriptional regulator